jgi:hypothetical protein
MAAEKHVDVMPNATKTYDNFIALFKYSIPVIIAATVLVVLLIAH